MFTPRKIAIERRVNIDSFDPDLNLKILTQTTVQFVECEATDLYMRFLTEPTSAFNGNVKVLKWNS